MHLDRNASIHVTRRKNGTPSTHPLSGVELRALRRLKRESPDSAFVFVSERGAPFSTAGFLKMVARLRKRCKTPISDSKRALPELRNKPYDGLSRSTQRN
jgi:hypothetical protein